MYGKMCLVLLDFVILTHSSPGRGRFYHDYNTGSKPQWDQDWTHWGHEWHHTTTKKPRITTTTKDTTTTSITEVTRAVPDSLPTSTPPQPTISDVNIRFGETNPSAPSSQIQEINTEKPMPQQFATVPEYSKTPEPVSGTGSGDNVKSTDGSLWHVNIYKRNGDQFEHICGGSSIREDTVVSAAHCFLSLDSKELPASQFKVAAGKIYSQYDDPRDTNAQYSDIKNISTSETIDTCLQPDLAVMILATPFKYTSAVKPACLKFQYDLHVPLLLDGNVGMVPSWVKQVPGDCKPSWNLKWWSLPFVSDRLCLTDQTENVYKTIGADRICAGDMNNTSHCEIDSGNGLVFYQGKIPYLHGVTTNFNRQCTKFLTRSFTSIQNIINEKAFQGIFINFNLAKCEVFYANKNEETEAVTLGNPVGPLEDDEVFTAQGIGSMRVPTFLDTGALEYQWHVGVYSKAWTPYMQICGGSLVKRDFVISAAHCFWDDAAGQQPASLFAIAGGKLYRPWNDSQDTYAQQSDVEQIILPVRFRGASTSFQDDLAILRLRTPFTYGPGVQSACVSLDKEFERDQLQPGITGTVCGWGLTEKNGMPSQILTYLDLPYVDVEYCFTNSEPAFMKYITSDKICAGDTITGKALCRGDSGGGFVVFSETIPYLHGIASTASGNENLCNAFSLAAFTSLYTHRNFITDNIPGIEKECEKLVTPGSATTEKSDRTGIVETGVGQTGNVEGMKVGNVGETPAFPPLPYYPNHFVCNCNCKA